MNIVDLIFKIDNNNILKDISCVGDFGEWYNTIDWSQFIEEKVSILLGSPICKNGGIVEIHNKMFEYQYVEDTNGGILYLSHSSFMMNIFQEVINYVSEGIQIFDKNGYFIYANKASESLEEYDKRDFIDKHLIDLYELDEDYSTILNVLRNKTPITNRCDRFKTRLGKNLITINSGYPIKIDNNLIGAVVFESDLSVLKQIKNRTCNLQSYIDNDKTIINSHMYTFEDIKHRSESMKEIIKFAKKVSLTDSSILISGETGTGKELIAQSIHSFSPRRNKQFVDVNCSAVPSNLIESMFFGTEKGAFTGSTSKKGFFEMANGGTIFLDEVNSMSMEMQAKLLRVLQEKRFRRVGGSKYIECDVRIIAASNENLFELTKKNIIRKDFYYRISTITINLPSLKERKEDIPLLAQYFLDELCIQYGLKNMNFLEDVYSVFIQYDWPGNIRELHHVINYAINRVTEEATVIQLADLPKYMQTLQIVTHRQLEYEEEKVSLCDCLESLSLEEQMNRCERDIIIKTLSQNQENITKSARVLGMSRQSLQYRMRKFRSINK